MKRRQLKGFLAGIWIVNILICLIVVGVFIWLNSRRAQVAPTLTPILAREASRLPPKPSITPISPPTQRPTITAWPTPSRGPSVTPMTQRPPNVTVIGYSVEQRGLEVYKFGTGPVNKLIVAGIHGGYEWNTIALADELIAYVNEHPERIPADTTLYILHDLNPDGLARGKTPDGRANAHNVDLNHNWPYRWSADWSRAGCFSERILTAGSAPGSEPEVQALIRFIDQIKPKALISYHSAALGIFAGSMEGFSPSMELAAAVAQVTDYPYPPIDTKCDYTGNLADWASDTHNIPAIDIELTNHQDTDFEQNLRVLQVFLGWKK